MQGEDYLKPLCPLRHETFDDTRYLPIDSSEKRFNDFKREFGDSGEWVGRGHLVIVTGDSGYGKTSLIQRCAAYLRDQAKAKGYCEAVPVDMSDEWLKASSPIQERIGETLECILDALGMRIKDQQRAEISSASTSSAFRKLAALLSSRSDASGNPLSPIVAVVLLPKYSTPDEISEYYNLARKGMIFFAEAYEDLNDIRDMQAEFKRMEANSVLLELDVLKPGDVDRLVGRIRAEAGNMPAVPAAVVQEIEQEIIRARMSAGELARMASGALRIAAEEKATELRQAHITSYYRRMARK